VALPGATDCAWVSHQAQFEYRVDWHDFCLVSAVIHRQGQKPRAYAPFCSHLYSDSIQGSARASQTTGRTGKVDNLGQDLLLESSTDHRPRTRTRRLPTFTSRHPWRRPTGYGSNVREAHVRGDGAQAELRRGREEAIIQKHVGQHCRGLQTRATCEAVQGGSRSQATRAIF
jgi:hypothetical protein